MTRQRGMLPGVSCLMVTQPGREGLIRRSIECFNRQTLGPRQLVIVHDGDRAFIRRLREMPEAARCEDLTIVDAGPGARLGALRNQSIEVARHEFVCQWDDDDLHHPEFLARQYDRLVEGEADFCFLTDQWHYFEGRGFVFWDDWSMSRPPLDLIEGSLFGRRDRMPNYPDLAVGEDTPLVREIVRRSTPIARLSDHGWLMMYSWHGANAWNFRHHLAISQARRMREEALSARIALIETALDDYPLTVRRLRFPCDDGWLEFHAESDGWQFRGKVGVESPRREP